MNFEKRTAPALLDSQFIRAQFPGVDQCLFFENAGGTLVPSQVSDRVYDYMRRNQVQPGAPYAASAEALERIERGHRQLAEMINASPDELVIGHSTTLNVYILANALRHLFRPGDEIIVTNLDHEANSGAWRRLAEFGLVIKEWQINPDTCSLGGADQLEQLLSDRTRLVCCTWCSNITGTIHDIQQIIEAAHAHGAWVCADAVAYAPHRAIDLREVGVDFCLFSLYKLYGPHLGALFGRRELLLDLPNQNHFFFGDTSLPYKLQPGGYLHETAASIEGITDYLDLVYDHHFGDDGATRPERYAKVFAMFAAHEERISAPLMDFLKNVPRVRIIGLETADRRRRVPTISLVVDGVNSDELPRRLARQNIGISSGHFYAKRCIDALGLQDQNGVIRISMVHYNQESEVTQLIEALDQLL